MKEVEMIAMPEVWFVLVMIILLTILLTAYKILVRDDLQLDNTETE